jgi:DNA-binding transcriptional regulator GbsR (MarR family)
MTKIAFNEVSFAFYLSKLRIHESELEVITKSRISVDVFNLLAIHHYSGKVMTLKELFHSTKYSQRGVRLIIDEFISEDLVRLSEGGEDKRFKFIIPQPKFLKYYLDSMNLANASLNKDK